MYITEKMMNSALRPVPKTREFPATQRKVKKQKMLPLKFLYPEGRKAAVCFSFDDGPVDDRQMVEILNRYGLKGTFNLNSGCLNSDDRLFIRKEEVAGLYAGHEVASHSVHHSNLTELFSLDPDRCIREITDDKKMLEDLCGKTVCGFAYPFDEVTEDLVNCVADSGFSYARCGVSHEMCVPENYFRWGATVHWNEDLALYKEKLLRSRMELPVLLICG